MKPGDLLLVRGTALLSQEIMKATGGSFSHVGIVVCSMEPMNKEDGIIIEALDRVKTRPFHLSTLQASYWEIWSNKTLADDQRWAIVNEACDYSAMDYAWGRIGEQALDDLFHTTWFTKLPSLNGKPICSYLAAVAYKSIGETLGTDFETITPSDAHGTGIAEFVAKNPKYELVLKKTNFEAGK
jgi:hypothetical protein